jgi:metallo-beta-lactamase family protein
MLIDCGLFQGTKELRLRNWAPLPIDPSSADQVVLTRLHRSREIRWQKKSNSNSDGRLFCRILRRLISDSLLCCKFYRGKRFASSLPFFL